MKFFTVLCLIGLAAASSSVNQLKWQPGKTYTFNYSGRLLTGLPELANHFSGLGLNCQVHLTVGSGSTVESQEFGIKITSPHFSRVNQPLKTSSESDQSRNNWRNLPLPSFSPVPEESRRYLETPAVFRLSPQGGFVSIVVSGEEPEWSVNFKKALVTLFQTQFQEDYPSQELSEAVNQIESAPSDSSYEPLTYWRTQEESLDGVCDVTYQINELPTYMIRDRPEEISYPSSCPQGSKVYEMIKTRDVNSCSKRTSFVYYKPGFFKCNTGNCEGMWSRSSITRYVACRSSQGMLNIQSIVNEAELQQNLFGFNTEKFLTGNMQNLTLVEQSDSPSGRSSLPYPSNRVELQSLFYEYKLSNINKRPEENLVNQVELEESTSTYKTLPRHILSTGTYTKEERERINPEKIVPQMKSLFKQIVEQDLFNIVDIPEKQVTFKGLTIARSFSLLPKSEIRRLYEELKSEFSSSEEKTTMFKNMFFDTLAMGGSVANIKFIKEMILESHLTAPQMITFFSFLPHYVLAPTQPLLESLYELVTSSYIRQRPMIYNHAILSYSKLIQKACLAENRSTSYPTFVFGNFCSPDSPVVLTKWIPYLQTELYHSGSSEHRNAIVVALGLMNHKNIIPIIVPLFEKVNPSSPEYSSLTRYLSIYSMANVGRQFPDIVVPMLYSVFSNPAESTEIRIAALNVMLRLNPSMSVFHKIASSTWWEKDSEVLQVVNTALFSLSQQQESEVESLYTSVQRKAWLVYPLIKKTSGTFPTSGVIYSSEYLKRLGVGYSQVQQWIDSKDSIVPSDMYARIVYYLDRYQFTPFESGLRIRGGMNIVQQLLEIINPELKGVSEDQTFQKVKHQLHQEWSHVIEKLQLKARKTGMAEGAWYMSLFEDTQLFHSFQSTSSEMLREKILPLMSNAEKLGKILSGEETSLNFQRMVNLAPSEFSIPSDMGFPIVVEVHMPTTINVRGKMSVKLNNANMPTVRTTVKTLFGTQLTGYVGTLCPFTNEFVSTGIDEHNLINLPVDFSIMLDVPSHKLSLKLHALNINRPIDVFHYHIRPYTVHQGYYDLTPMTLSQNVRFIESRESTKRKEYVFGQTVGLKLRTVLTTESPFTDMRAVFQKFNMFNRNPINFLRFQWMAGAQTEYGYPSFRKHEVQLKYNPAESETKEFEVQVQLGLATKSKGEPFKFHIVKPTGPVESENTIMPLKIVSKPLGEVPEQRSSQEKIKSMIEQQPLEEASAATLRVTTIFKGTGRAHGTTSYNLNFLGGSQGLRQKWNLQMENERINEKICISGHLNVPQVPIWNIESLRNSPLVFTYENSFGFGSSCQNKLIVRGSTKSNEEQKKYSKESIEARELEKLIQKGVPVPEIPKLAAKVRKQASILNEVDIEVEYQNIPSEYKVYGEYWREALKSYLWPYMTQNSEGYMSGSSGSNKYKLIFNPTTETFNLIVTSSQETLKFMHVRIAYPLNYLFPLPASRTSLLDMTKPIVGRPYFPSCHVSGKWIETYDNTTTSLPLSDECYHLLSGDCSHQKRFGVLVRRASQQGSSSEPLKVVKVYLGKTSIELVPETSSFSGSYPKVKVVVNGTKEIEVRSQLGHFVPVYDEHRHVVCRVMASIDGVLVLRSSTVNVLFNGRKISVEASYLYKNQLCGLCGDLNDNKLADLRGPKQCVYSKPELLVASYRVPLPNHQCSPLPRQIEEELVRETARCSKYQEIPTKVVESIKISSGKCSSHRHEVVFKPTEICFSKIPVMRCGISCKPERIVEKTIPFVCLPHGKLSELYAMEALAGKILPQLENLPTAYPSEMMLPKSCEPINTNL